MRSRDLVKLRLAATATRAVGVDAEVAHAHFILIVNFTTLSGRGDRGSDRDRPVSDVIPVSRSYSIREG